MNCRILACLAALALGGLFAAGGPARPEPPAPEKGKVFTNALGMKLALIPPGKFLMGSPAAEKERDPDETQHEVTITRPFYMGVHEVTQEQYEKVMGGKNPSHFKKPNGGGPDHPVEQ